MKILNITEEMVHKISKKDLKEINAKIDEINKLKPCKSQVNYINNYIKDGSSFYALQVRVHDVFSNLKK